MSELPSGLNCKVLSKLQLQLLWSYLHFICISAVNIISIDFNLIAKDCLLLLIQAGALNSDMALFPCRQFVRTFSTGRRGWYNSLLIRGIKKKVEASDYEQLLFCLWDQWV